MQITVKLFGSVRETAGVKEMSVELNDGATLADLRERLARDHEIFERLGDRLAASVNFEVEPWERRLADGDEVAFLPPVAGGAERCTLSDLPLDPGEVVARVSGPGMGGLVTFIGAVRDHARGARIRHLEYEAYPGMAEQEMERICAAAAERWPGVRVAIAHRVGHLEIGDLAVVIAAAAPHRGEAFEACRFAIDTLKETVPIWKKEFAESGEYWVDDRP
ncbi:MAG: molybdenum cofactor biosynthesis protein [Myxococcota bacterium]